MISKKAQKRAAGFEFETFSLQTLPSTTTPSNPPRSIDNARNQEAICPHWYQKVGKCLAKPEKLSATPISTNFKPFEI
jgi:hypothetical protein